MDGTARPWQLALGRTMSAASARAGADSAASGCCDGLAWRQRAHGIVLWLLEVVRWMEHRSQGEPQGTTEDASAPCLRGYAGVGSTRQRPPRHTIGSGSLASGAACLRTSPPSGRPQNPTGVAPMRADAGGQR
jgi:hypothetical protein